VIGAVRHRAAGARKHSTSPDIPIGSAQSSAKVPLTEQTREAAAKTVTKMSAAEAAAVRRQEFKNKLKKAIEDATPKPTTESQADHLMAQGSKDASHSLRGELDTQKHEAAGPMEAAAAKEVSPADQHVAPKTDLAPEPLGAPPAPVSTAAVVPAPLPPEQLDYSEDRAPTDQAMAEGGVTKEQLEKGNEPTFNQSLSARSTAEKHEAAAEPKYRQSEATVQAKVHAQSQAAMASGLGGMHGLRALHVAGVIGQQFGTAAKDAAERKRITDKVTDIKDRTRSDVDAILKKMEQDATTKFEAGLAKAEQAYHDTFEDEKGGVGTWLTTWGSDWEELIENSLAKARIAYMREVDVAIEDVADCVDQNLGAATQRVKDGLAEVDTFVAGLDAKVIEFGEEAKKGVAGDFEAMEKDIDDHRDALINKLAEQYKASHERMLAMEEKLREENKSLWQRVYDATVGLIKKILAFKDMLLNVLAKAADVIGDIISDPIGFLGNLVEAVMRGLKGFMSRIGMHLQKGLMEWLFGALGGAGLQMPEHFDLQGIVSIVLQVLGLTYANFRARAVAIVGEPVVAALEKTAEVFKVIVTEGIPGLWRFIKEKLTDLKSMVLDAILDYVKEKVIIAGITWVIGLLNPASAFFKACKAIYDIVMFFVERGSQILALVNAIIDSIAAIAKGSLDQAATWVENALAKAIPVAIGFLASLLGLGDISGTIRGVIEKAQTPVNKAIDWLINGAVKLVKAAGSLVMGLVGGKKTEPDAHVAADADPAKEAKITVGLTALSQSIATHEKNGTLTHEAADQAAAEVKQAHPVFSEISVQPTDGKWQFYYAASPKKPGPAAPMAPGDQVLEVSVLDQKPPGHSTVGALALGTPASWGHDPTDPRRGAGRASPKIFEKRVGQAVAKSAGVDEPPTTATGKFERGTLPAQIGPDELVAAPTAGDFGKQPDFVLTGRGQVEVFEATLDARFEIGTTEDLKETSHKRVQLAGTVIGLARMYPGHPIIFNIVTHQPLDGEIRGKLERELRTLRAQLATEGLPNPVQIIWRS
jgi:hypothetical protein